MLIYLENKTLVEYSGTFFQHFFLEHSAGTGEGKGKEGGFNKQLASVSNRCMHTSLFFID
jgi:hypothetical protein